MAVQLYKVFDAAYPPETPPPGADGVLIYVGQQGFTPHVWTVSECDRFASLRQFPCWVPDLGARPADDAKSAVEAVEALGWAREPEPETRLILLDTETSRVPAFVELWSQVVASSGYFPGDYGSLNYVDANLAYSVWAADWDGIPALVPGQTVGGTQYAAGVLWDGARVDLSVVSPALWARGGRGPRR